MNCSGWPSARWHAVRRCSSGTGRSAGGWTHTAPRPGAARIENAAGPGRSRCTVTVPRRDRDRDRRGRRRAAASGKGCWASHKFAGLPLLAMVPRNHHWCGGPSPSDGDVCEQVGMCRRAGGQMRLRLSTKPSVRSDSGSSRRPVSGDNEGPCDGEPLELAPAELVRIASEKIVGWREAHAARISTMRPSSSAVGKTPAGVAPGGCRARCGAD